MSLTLRETHFAPAQKRPLKMDNKYPKKKKYF